MKVAFGWCSRRFKSTIQAFRYNKFSLISTFLYIIFFWRHNLTGCRIGLEFSRLIPPFSVALFLIYSCLLVATCLLEIPCQTVCFVFGILLGISASLALLTQKYLVSFYLAKFQTADIYNQIAPACTASNRLIVPTYSESHSFTSALLRSALKKGFRFLLLLWPLFYLSLEAGSCFGPHLL